MNVNLFQWIREGVRHSVLLGVSDAVQQIGTHPTSDDLSARLGEYLRSGAPIQSRMAGPAPAARKRLGRSLKELAPVENPAENS